LAKVTLPGRAPITTILVIPLSADQNNLAADWAAACAEVILRRCPVCQSESIIGHGRRHKQAHDAHHDWIGIRRGLCNACGKTFTFLPMFSLPYTHYSLLARSQALRQYFVERCSWESATPTLKDPHRVADASTVRRWFRGLDCSQPAFSFLRQTVSAVSLWLARGEKIQHGALPLSWLTLDPFLRMFWPLRL